MSIYEKIKSICDERGISIYRIEKDCGLGNGSIMKWEISSPKVENIIKVADYFEVSVDYLLGREIKNYAISTLSAEKMISPINFNNNVITTTDELSLIFTNSDGMDHIEKIYKQFDLEQKIFVLAWIIEFAQSQGIEITL